MYADIYQQTVTVAECERQRNLNVGTCARVRVYQELFCEKKGTGEKGKGGGGEKKKEEEKKKCRAVDERRKKASQGNSNEFLPGSGELPLSLGFFL